ncbi:hypothetical protein NIES4071_10950 [Calothrix sp. NIES-4071]|nr:hypothetical protein NIES4071_10950 [Calothrix sp. NIES-4071]BAZ55435.1 hypothetical protein NIES4105_10910 [Calothrix sp. NIES-4105]
MTILSDPTQIELEISPNLVEQLWRHHKSTFSHWNIFLNQICLQTFLPTLEEDVILDSASVPSFWAHVNGAAFTWRNKRIILIPEISIDTTEYTIPQEWVDIEQLVGDYYLAVKINPDELSMRVWGYTTHERIKSTATYNFDRTYSLDAQYLIPDLNVLWVVSQLNPDEPTRVTVPTFSPVPTTQAENLLLRCSNTNIIQPRLEIPFSLWASLITDDNWRQRLYQLRTGQPAKTNLSQWLQNTFTDTWQAIDSILSPSSGASFGLRATETDTSIKRVKSLNLPNEEAFLVLGLEAEPDGRIGIRIQLRSRSQDEYLPPETTLKLISASGDVIQSIQSRNQDNIIQLKRFKSPVGVEFSIQVEVGDFVVTENCVS